jgi:glutamine amidotransferase/cyclase
LRGAKPTAPGDQYDVREKDAEGEGGDVRNLGKPVELAARYYSEGADEITFLNITAFRDSPLEDNPLQARGSPWISLSWLLLPPRLLRPPPRLCAAAQEMLQRASEEIFVPLCIGGGIKDGQDAEGRRYSAVGAQAAAQRPKLVTHAAEFDDWDAPT